MIDKHLAIGMLAFMATSCASQPPEAIRAAPPRNPTLTEVRTNIDAFVDTRVRWGGTIANVRNLETETLVDIVARELTKQGRPKKTDKSQGRFQARIAEFIDPVVYEQGRDLTVVGVIEGGETRNIGQYPYRYPVVAVQQYYLWEPVSQRLPYDYYDPWWYGRRDPYHEWYDRDLCCEMP